MKPEISVRPAGAADIEAIVLLSRVLALHVEDPDPGDDPGAILFEVWKGNDSALRFYKQQGAGILNDRHLMCLPISDYATQLASVAAKPVDWVKP